MVNALEPASLSIDLDNQWAYLKTSGDNSWRDYPSFLDTAGPRIARFLAEADLKPTIFVVGMDLDFPKNRQAIETFYDMGCELGNHTENHCADFHELNVAEMEAEIKNCEEKIERATGNKPTGFRGPSFQISETIANVLIRRGYKYDASSYPNSIGPLARAYHFMNSDLTNGEKKRQAHLFGGFGKAFSTLAPHEWQLNCGSITEIPVTTMPISRLPIHFTYLNFLADKSTYLAELYVSFTIKLLRITNTQPSLLLHATDFLGLGDNGIPRYLPGMERSYEDKLQFLRTVISRFQNHYRFFGIAEFLNR